jgi:hemoglobin
MRKKDIANKQDLEIIVNHFYEKVKQDDLIAIMFEHVNWDTHLPLMYDFWDNVLFYTGNYTGNPMAKHMMANDRFQMTKNHFERWLMLFDKTVDELFSGKNAALLKERARSIATIMQIKIFGNEYVFK